LLGQKVISQGCTDVVGQAAPEPSPQAPVAYFALLKEFGNRGFQPGNLIGPDDILVDGQNRAYVSSLRKRGISVYQLSN